MVNFANDSDATKRKSKATCARACSFLILFFFDYTHNARDHGEREDGGCLPSYVVAEYDERTLVRCIFLGKTRGNAQRTITDGKNFSKRRARRSMEEEQKYGRRNSFSPESRRGGIGVDIPSISSDLSRGATFDAKI